MTLANKRSWVIISGTHGIGKALVFKALELGDNVMVTAHALSQFDDQFTSHPNLHKHQLDITDPEQVELAINLAVNRWGSIDVLINNQEAIYRGFFEEISPDSITQQFNINVFGAMNTCRAVLPHMRRKKSGQIYNISSISGSTRENQLSIYSASKYALEAFSESLAEEVRQFGISVTLIQPNEHLLNKVSLYQVKFGDRTVPDYSFKQNQNVRARQLRNTTELDKFAQLMTNLIELPGGNIRPIRFG